MYTERQTKRPQGIYQFFFESESACFCLVDIIFICCSSDRMCTYVHLHPQNNRCRKAVPIPGHWISQ